MSDLFQVHADLVIRYHWALLTGPKSDRPGDPGKRYHAKQYSTLWAFCEEDIRLAPTNMILVRVLVAKVSNRRKLEAVLPNIPMRPEVPGWTCKTWVQEAFEALKDAQAIDCPFGWATVCQTALWYVHHKAERHRFDGLAQTLYYDEAKVATWDMLEEGEKHP